MRLVDLDPVWFGRPRGQTWPHVSSLSDAVGLRFRCPGCVAAGGGGNWGVHTVVCWDPSVGPDVPPRPGRWRLCGTGFDDLTLGPRHPGGASSVIMKGCGAHFWIRDGRIELVKAAA